MAVQLLIYSHAYQGNRAPYNGQKAAAQRLVRLFSPGWWCWWWRAGGPVLPAPPARAAEQRAGCGPSRAAGRQLFGSIKRKPSGSSARLLAGVK